MTRKYEQEPENRQPTEAGLLDGYPEGAFLVRSEGSIIAANRAGSDLSSALGQETILEFADLVKRSAEVGSLVVKALTVPTDRGERTLEVTVIPRGTDGAYLVLTRDLSLDRNLKAALMEFRQRYKDLVDVSSNFAWEVGPEGEFVFVSARGALGYSTDELMGRRPDEFVVDAGAYSPLPFVSDQPLDDVDLWMRRADETLACVSVSALPIRADDGTWLGARGVCRDITEERERESALLRARHRAQILNYVIGAIHNEVNPAYMLTAAASAAARALSSTGCRIYRRSDTEELVVAAEYGNQEGSEDWIDMAVEVGDPEAVLASTRDSSEILLAATHYRNIVNGSICVWKASEAGFWNEDERLLVRDVANQLGIAIEQIINHERILRLSRTDALTGLLNRRAFYDEEMPRRLRRLVRSEDEAALFYLDLDNFKWINDTFGHQRGDEVLLALRDTLIEKSRPGDLIARVGGDEFVMWLDGISPDVAEHRAQALVEAGVELKRFSENGDHPLGLSVGIAMYDPQGGESLDSLLARADIAMYTVKRRGKGGYERAAAVSVEPRARGQEVE